MIFVQTTAREFFKQGPSLRIHHFIGYDIMGMDFNNLTIFFVVRESVQRAWKLFDKEPADDEGGGEDDGHAQHPPNP